jgi:hypothetical protein
MCVCVCVCHFMLSNAARYGVDTHQVSVTIVDTIILTNYTNDAYTYDTHLNAARFGVDIHSYTHTLIHSHTHTLIHSYTHTHIHTYTHTLIHSYTHTLIHTHILTFSPFASLP